MALFYFILLLFLLQKALFPLGPWPGGRLQSRVVEKLPRAAGRGWGRALHQGPEGPLPGCWLWRLQVILEGEPFCEIPTQPRLGPASLRRLVRRRSPTCSMSFIASGKWLSRKSRRCGCAGRTKGRRVAKDLVEVLLQDRGSSQGARAFIRLVSGALLLVLAEDGRAAFASPRPPGAPSSRWGRSPEVGV